MTRAVLGIIGGSGIYDLPGLEDVREEIIRSPWGEPSAALTRGVIGGLPIAFLPPSFALTVAAMSYNGKLEFSLMGDYDAIPDIDLIGDFLQESLTEMLEAAGRPPTKPRRKAAAATG